jgi:hypothetical protein
MKNSIKLATVVILFVMFEYACRKELKPTGQTGSDSEILNAKAGSITQATVSVFATGLNNPRGLKWGPDGNLYVAEGGVGGTDSSVGQCEQVVPPVGPYVGSPVGGRISKIDAQGTGTTVTDLLPSSKANDAVGGFISGVADIAFIGNTLYALLAGAGCSHGVPSVPNGIVRINADGSWTLIADLSAFQQSHPVAVPEPGDFEPDGTWYSMINVRDDLYAIEPNHGEMVKVTTSGEITRVIDFSASQGHIVPTALAYHGNFYVGNLGVFPITLTDEKIYKVTPSGEIKIVASGLNTVLGLVIDDRNRMYVLEMTAGAPFPTPNAGRIVQIDPNGRQTVIATGLSMPTGMTLGPDGNLYVSNQGLGPTAIGGGQVLKVTLTN